MHIRFNSRELVLEAEDANDARQARELLDLYLRRLGAPDSDYYAAALALGELIANVVRHAPGPIFVRVDWSGESPVLSVRDTGPGFTFSPALPEDMLAEGGRGLFIVSAVVSELQVERLDGSGTVVRARLPVMRKDA